jgi:poly(hydroxyalkanoate) depolymerase family esterase
MGWLSEKCRSRSIATLEVDVSRKNSNFVMAKAIHKAVIVASTQIALTLAGVASHAQAASPIQVTNFGSNPGNLIMFKYVPERISTPAPLVVVLHGCKQESPRFAEEAGWMQIADKMGVALAIPGQKQENNQNNCFNWFSPTDIRRDQGEALSIKQIVDKMKSDHNIDSKRVYVTGLSAGGAMTSVMLATYPDVFAAGGIIAGLPYRCAESLSDALQCMGTGHPSNLPGLGLPFPGGSNPKVTSGSSTLNVPFPPGLCLFFPLFPGCIDRPVGDGTFTPDEWGNRVRNASNHKGPFPRVSIWHGSADTTVNPINGSEAVEQWANVHGLSPKKPSEVNTIKGFPHQVFKDGNGTALVESVSITGMNHGDPIDPGTGTDQCGTPDAFVLDVNICSSFFIAKFWGLAPSNP